MGEWMYTHIFLTSALVGKWSALPLGRITPWERARGAHCIGGWVDLRAGLDAMEKRKFLSPSGLGTPDPLVVQPVPSRYTGLY
jgi:hypothetical protein